MLINNINKICKIGRSLFVVLVLVSGSVAVNAQAAVAKTAPAQAPSPSPTPAEEAVFNGYRVSGSAEVGFRWRSVTGNLDTYRSHLNYSQGL
ncbi:MAG TPA: hypothetical protein VHQ01_04320, partial [Pyrinomonadaceae bacterium]|nr:hypothetical protein [Pyrinomonadaceae bacterium]